MCCFGNPVMWMDVGPVVLDVLFCCPDYVDGLSYSTLVLCLGLDGITTYINLEQPSLKPLTMSADTLMLTYVTFLHRTLCVVYMLCAC